jgi:hypothetical protein
MAQRRVGAPAQATGTGARFASLSGSSAGGGDGVRAGLDLDGAVAATSVRWPPGISREAITDTISVLRSAPTSCPDESLTCRVASGSSRARRRAKAIGA